MHQSHAASCTPTLATSLTLTPISIVCHQAQVSHNSVMLIAVYDVTWSLSIEKSGFPKLKFGLFQSHIDININKISAKNIGTNIVLYRTSSKVFDINAPIKNSPFCFSTSDLLFSVWVTSLDAVVQTFHSTNKSWKCVSPVAFWYLIDFRISWLFKAEILVCYWKWMYSIGEALA